MDIFVYSERHYTDLGGLPQVEYKVLYDGVEYRCDDIQLEHLYAGVPIEECDVVRLDEGDDD